MKKLTKTIILSSLLASSLLADDFVTKEEFYNLQDFVEEIETKTLTDRMNITPELRLRVDNFKYKMDGIDANRDGVTGNEESARDNPFPQTKEWDPAYAVTFKLNMDAEISEDVNFNGTLQISKNSQNNQRLCILSPQPEGTKLTAASKNVDMAFDITRAYVDIKWNKDGDIPFYTSFGILPTSGGSSSNVMEDRPRKSVFPSLIFDSNVYGGILTADLSDVTGLENTFVRIIGGKAFTLSSEQYYYQCNRETIQNMDVAGIFFEVKLPYLGDNNFYVGANRNGNIKATPYLGSASNDENTGSNTNIKRAQPIGSIWNVAAGFQINNLRDTNVDLFFNAAMSIPEGDDDSCVNYSGKESEGGCEAAPTPFTQGDYAGGKLLQENGYALHLGAKYSFETTGTQIGAEFNYGSKYWWSATQGSEDVFNKLATRGNVGEVYVNQELKENITARVGYMQIQENYTGSGWHFGEPADKIGKQENIYLVLDAKF